ncbi:hypothetical protein [Aneurinibacillus tyrosinisolvens]|uniref:hypothetical protein n=1 Tax=Aneurinibacillus tyrosinisolvens TaxID=1443435 RepID=UPI00069C0811|nr:hypothetical protein [Aneurinibacillus tyrosinisolvens]
MHSQYQEYDTRGDEGEDTELLPYLWDNRYYGIEDYTTVTEEQVFGIPEYQNMMDLIEVCFAELQVVLPSKKIGGVFYHFTGELEHGITFAHALVELCEMGYSDLYQKGLPLHRLQMHLNRQRPEEVIHEAIIAPGFTSILDARYWNRPYNDPHSIKVPFSAMSLLRYLPEEERSKVEFNVCKILCQNK